MDMFILKLINVIGSPNLWGVVGKVIPFVAISVLFVLGFNIIRNIIGEIQYGYDG